MLIFQIVLLFSVNIFAEKNICITQEALSFTCPQNITIQCWQDYKNTQLTGHPQSINSGQWYFSYEDEINLTPCREGYIIRTWTGINPLGQWSCQQTITIEYNEVFTGQQIQWPADWTGNCDEEIPFIEPGYNAGFCDMIAHSYKDDTIKVEGSACMKILRNWKVIDCCRYNPNSGSNQGIWLHTQVLTVKKFQKPTFVECKDWDIGAMNNDCTASFRLSKSATDVHCNITSDLNWKVMVDYYSCFGIDTVIFGSGNQMDVDLKNMGIGTHKIIWEVYDNCGNVNQCEESIVITDKKAPTPFCYLGSHTVLMPTSGMLEVHAKEYVKDAYDNCTPKDKLRYSWRINVKDSIKVFTCADLGFQFLPIYVFDETGNKDFCFIFTRVEMHGSCNPGQNLISGKITEINGQPAGNVLVKVGLMPDITYLVDTSTVEGMVQFPFVETNAEPHLFIERISGTNPGYTTLDLVLLGRYLLGLYKPQMESLFRWAADVNLDGKVNTLDLIRMRSTILGQTESLLDSSVPARIVVPDPENPGQWIEHPSLRDFKDGFDIRILSIGSLSPFIRS